MNRTQQVIATISQVNPVPAPSDPAPLDARGRADLAAVLNVPTTPARRLRRPLRLALPTVAVMALALVVVPSVLSSRGGEGAEAAVPRALDYRPVSAPTGVAALLTELAARVAPLPDDTGSGRYAHLRSREWNLFTRVDGERVESEVVPQLRETWFAADGSGRTVTSVERPGKPVEISRRDVGAGAPPTMWPLRSLSPDDEELAGQLGRGHPRENGPAERFVAVQDAYGDMPLEPGVRAAILRYVAATPGLVVTGAVDDRVGRAGIAVSVNSDYSGLPTRYTLIFDERTGRLLDSESTLTTTAGKLGVPIPSVIEYKVFLSAEYTAALPGH
jgi:hypothetical protein